MTIDKIEWIFPARGGQNLGQNTNFDIRISCQSGGKADTSARDQINISIRKKFMETLRWVAGDRVAVGVYGDSLCMKRVLSGGFAVSPNGATKQERNQSIGTACNCVIKLSSRDSMQLQRGFSRSYVDPVIIDGVVFLPMGETEASL